MNASSVPLFFIYLSIWFRSYVIKCVHMKGIWYVLLKRINEMGWVSACLWISFFVFTFSNFTKWCLLRTSEIFMSHFLYQTFRSTINQILAIILVIWLGMKAQGVFCQSLKPKVSPLKIKNEKLVICTTLENLNV